MIVSEKNKIELEKISQEEDSIKLPPLPIKFLNLIKTNNDQGKLTRLKDIVEHFNYKNHQAVSSGLRKLEKCQLLERRWENGKRIIAITSKGVDFIYELGCSYLTKLEQTWIEKLRREGKVKPSFRTISQIISDFTKEIVPGRDDLIKNAILRELKEEEFPESTSANIYVKIRQILLEISKEFIENYANKTPLM